MLGLTRKKKVKLYILLAAIWFIVSLPLPWMFNAEIPSDIFYSYVGIIIIISTPFIALAIAWTLKPELTT